MNEDTKQKTRCPKKYALSETEVADVVGCSVVQVKKVRSKPFRINSVQAKTILAIDELANEQKSLLIYNLKQM